MTKAAKQKQAARILLELKGHLDSSALAIVGARKCYENLLKLHGLKIVTRWPKDPTDPKWLKHLKWLKP